MLVGQRKQTPGKGGEPVLLRLGQGQSEGKAQRVGAHGGQVAEVHRQGLVAQRLGVDAREEVPAFDQHVGGDRQQVAWPGLQQRAVVANAQHHRRRGHAAFALEMAPYQLELTHGTGRLLRR